MAIDPPGLAEVSTLSLAMGMSLTPHEVMLVRDFIADALPELEIPQAFAQHEERLPMLDVPRTDVRAPRPGEDPFNVFITICRAAGTTSGPLAGLRVGLKDHISVAGVPLTFGSRQMAGYVPRFDATVVSRLLQAGAVITGKLNMEPFSSGAGTCGYREYGRVLNPWDTTRSAGGSSSGSAAAVAARSVDIAFGGDQGGSVRLPAAWCGVVGFKPSHGLLPHTGAFGAEMIHDHLGIMGLGVQGVARVADAVAGPDGYDPRQLALPPPPPLERDLWAGVAGARVGILAEGFTEHTEPDVGQAVLTAAEVLRSCGAEVGSATVPVHTKAMSIAAPLLYGSLGVWFDTAFAGLPQGGYVPTDLIEAVLHARSQDAPSLPIYVAAEAILGRYMLHQSAGLSAARSANLRRYVTDCYQRAFESFDLLVMPTVPIKAPRYEESEQPAENAALPLSGGSLGSSLNALTVNMWPFNFTGYPAMSIPCAVSDGLPIGMQIVGRRNEDDLVLRAGYAFERDVAWDVLTTPVSLAAEPGHALLRDSAAVSQPSDGRE